MPLTIHTAPDDDKMHCSPSLTATCQPILQRRYVAFLRDGGRILGSSMHPYTAWVGRRIRDFRQEHGIHRFAPLPHEAFDRWLNERTRRQVACDECVGDGHWHGVTCVECGGSGFVPDVCRSDVRFCYHAGRCAETNASLRAGGFDVGPRAPTDMDQVFGTEDLPW